MKTIELKNRQLELDENILEATKTILLDKKTIEEQTEKLRDLDKFKTRFFANVSHELRTPLTLILGPLNSLLKNKHLDEKSRTTLSKMQNSGKQLGKLINQILDLGKLDAAKMTLNTAPHVLFLLVRRILSAFESFASREGIQLNLLFLPPKETQIELDAQKLEIIVNNLLSNALKFTPSSATSCKYLNI